MAGIDIKTPFDDDSHTLHDGALQRFFRMRKWMFATAFALTLLDLGWFNFEKFAQAAFLDALPLNAVLVALTAAGIYLLVQAVFVLAQVLATYEHSLKVRDELIATPGAASWSKTFANIDSRLNELSTPSKRRTFDAEDEREVQALSMERSEMKAKLLQAMRRHAPLRRSAITAEVFLDAIRLLPMPVLLVYALFAHGVLTVAAA